MRSKVLVSLLLMLVGTFHARVTHAQWFGYKTFEECLNKELQKYKEPTGPAASAVILYCEAEFDKKADKEIRQLWADAGCDEAKVGEFIRDSTKIMGSKQRALDGIRKLSGLKCKK